MNNDDIFIIRCLMQEPCTFADFKRKGMKFGTDKLYTILQKLENFGFMLYEDFNNKHKTVYGYVGIKKESPATEWIRGIHEDRKCKK